MKVIYIVMYIDGWVDGWVEVIRVDIHDIISKIQLNMRIPGNFKYILFIRLRKFPSNFS